ncbi:hypothetical protein BH23GEM8_BH23GEM8_03360 [soil metagenome]
MKRLSTGEATCLRGLTTVLRTLADWKVTEDMSLNVSSDGHSPGVKIVAVRGITTLLFAGLTLQDDFPDFRKRREIYKRSRHDGGGHILIIVDAAQIRRVWIWERRRAGRLADYRESLEPESAEDLQRLLKVALDDLDGECDDWDSPAPAIHAMLERALRPVGQREGREFHRAASGEYLLDAIAGGSDPAGTWQVWRALTQIRLVDLSCGDGSWLLEAAATLETLYVGCLGRMAGWVLDSEKVLRSGSGRHRGFRDLLAQAGSGSACFDRHILERAILFNLHGVASRQLDAKVTQLRLTRALAATDDHLDTSSTRPELELRIVTNESMTSPRDGKSRATAPRRSELLAAARECDAAFSIVRDLQLGGRADANQLAGAYREIGKRREAIVARYRRDFAAGDGFAAAIEELYLHFPELLKRSRSTIFREPR